MPPVYALVDCVDVNVPYLEGDGLGKGTQLSFDYIGRVEEVHVPAVTAIVGDESPLGVKASLASL